MFYFLIFAITLIISFLIVRTGAIALKLTGMKRDIALFQALSAFSRTGFTTRESEMVIQDPLRRRIITWLIILGNAGLASVFVTIFKSSTAGVISHLATEILEIGVIILCFLVLCSLTSYKKLMTKLDNLIENQIKKRIVFLHLGYDNIFVQRRGFGLAVVTIGEDSPVCGRTLGEIECGEIINIGILRNDNCITLPGNDEKIYLNDRLLCYGNNADIEKCISADIMHMHDDAHLNANTKEMTAKEK